ncbi:MAG: ArsR/SmtB family transcription factor [Clostridium sp.]
METCNCNIIHEDVVIKVKDTLPQDETLYELAEFFKVFGDSTRIKIICALFQEEMCVCDLAALLGVSQSAISHQLRTLKAARLVKFRRDGKVIYYSLDDDHIKHIFDEGLKHIKE